MGADEMEDARGPRRDVVLNAEWNPLSLVGSWALYHAGSSDYSEGKTEQALIVGEVQPGVYLLEFYDLIEDEPKGQRIVQLEEFRKVDDEGGTWSFYDDREGVRQGLRACMA